MTDRATMEWHSCDCEVREQHFDGVPDGPTSRYALICKANTKENAHAIARAHNATIRALTSEPSGKAATTEKWYVGAMNDALFIINRPPRPAPVDVLTAGNPETDVIAALGTATPEMMTAAEEIVAKHNAAIPAQPSGKAGDGELVRVVRQFTNEIGNRIKITIEGPSSQIESILTVKEVDELKDAITRHSAISRAQSVPAGVAGDGELVVARGPGYGPAKSGDKLRLYDGSMDDPSDPHPWEIAFPGRGTIAKFRYEADARCCFAALSRAEANASGGGDGGLYVASRASIPARAAMWRDLRKYGYPIISTWIDEDGEGETADFSELWVRLVGEIASCKALILYAEPNDFPLKGALVEVGVAIGMDKPVFVCMPGVEVSGRTNRPIGSWIKHPLVTRNDAVACAMDAALAAAPSTAGGA